MDDQLLDLLRPYDIGDSKVRLGPKEDGGYVCSRISLEECEALYTYGVGNDTLYEEAFIAKYKKHAYLYDHTINGIHLKDDRITFKSEGLGNKPQCNDFLNHYNENDQYGRVLLKIDIEGDEYPFFEFADIEELARVTTGIILEIHWMDNERYSKQFWETVKKINKEFTLTHAHGNSWGGAMTFEGHVVPITWELSYVPNDMIKTKKLDKSEYPVKGLDYSNNPSIPDIKLDYI